MNIDLSWLYSWIWDVIQWFLQFVEDVFLYLPRLLYENFVGGFTYALSVVPDPCCFSQLILDINSLFSGAGGVMGGIDIGAGILYVMKFIDIPFGIRVVACAYIARFLLRRLPFIG
jgi:hypothetical protein